MTFKSTNAYVLLFIQFSSLTLMVRSQKNQNPPTSAFNTTVAWGNFFAIYPELWNKITTALNQGSSADLNSFANQIQTRFQSGLANPTTQPTDTTPGLREYQANVRRALLDIGLPGTAGIASSSGVTGAVTSYAMQSPFPIFVNQSGSLVGPVASDPTWFLGPHVCLVRTSAFNSLPAPIRNVTFCTSSRDDGRMNIVCWLPTLDTTGAAITGWKYTTTYRCCDGYQLAPLLNSSASSATPDPNSVNAARPLAAAGDEQRITLPDNRICQQ
ncbi:hypothetical protein BV898_07079 [Hypsibius exemplaris]|uniref:Uncharacterized protein n=1 Tax=Hypsibius exemplaris TaxID=2072580 RepID=A0A1W0WUE4_HYPEX|nr:hypothetical protein BV898_07079 [Hypsibius exemplaris]